MSREIAELLHRSIGLEAASIGTATVEQAIRGRMAQTGVASPDEYLARLHESPAELDELIEAVVVPESWFFRDGTPFATLASWVRETWQPAHAGAALRVLTAPCSTGEEPYTVAMTLLDAGLPPNRFTVDAVDISRRAIARAREAVYGSNSFRGASLDFRDRHFSLGPGGYSLSDQVRRQVRFAFGNILAPDFRPGSGRFDVIFCRNLLIYFDRPTQTQAVRALSQMLAPDGLLFVGHAESHMAGTAGLVSANYPKTFAFRFPAASATAPSPVRPSAAPSNRVTLRMPGRSTVRPFRVPAAAHVPRMPSNVPAATLPLATFDLEAARSLADDGRLEEAARLCEGHLRQQGASAAAWFLLGVVRDAAGDRPNAAACYSKTLYLEPGHQEALLRRTLLAQEAGDAASVTQLRRRLARVQQRSGQS